MESLILNSYLTNFCIYGLGSTGKSVINYFKKKKFKNFKVWDDGIKKRGEKKLFSKYLDLSNYIIVSPGISLKNAKLKKKLLENRHKIITDLDLFYLMNPHIKSIVVTGTNGKSTTCKILEHMLKKNKINVKLGGNIGKPILDLNLKNNPLVIIEASSYQLAYSKFIKPDYAIIINISIDHLDWHGSFENYINSKLKIFSNQETEHFALLNSKLLEKKFNKNRYQGKLKFVNINKYKKIQSKIKNNYLNSRVNTENMSYVYELSKILKINEKSFIKSLKSFKGLDHRHEIFYKKNNKIFVNDSKATSFEASKFALKSNSNIYWIVGGKPKVGDKFLLGDFKKNITKAYIIGNYTKYFKKFLKNKVNFKISRTLNSAVISIFKDIKNSKKNKITILLSPASASFDQFRNFEHRGNKFKKIVRSYAKRYI